MADAADCPQPAVRQGDRSRSAGAHHWVFGYGSLMWKPGFPYVEARHAALIGRHRALCVYSVHHRGTCTRPGLVFGLDRGGVTHGVAFRVTDQDWPDVLAYLQEREQVTGVYREKTVQIVLHRPIALSADGSELSDRDKDAFGQSQNGAGLVTAIAFVVDETHRQYARTLGLVREAQIISGASGKAGPNADYILSTAKHLEDMQIADPHLRRLAGMLRGTPDGFNYRRVGAAKPNGLSFRKRSAESPRLPLRFPKTPELKANYRRRIKGL